MAEKHESTPSAMRPSKEFRQRVVIGSASSWDKNILSLFHVAFDRMTCSDLRQFLDAKYFESPGEDQDCYKGNSCESRLTVGYHKILRASEEARGEDFSGSKKDIYRKFESNPLRHFYSSLSACFTTHSAESVDLVRSKTRTRSGSPSKKAKISRLTDDDSDSHFVQQSPPSPPVDLSYSSPSPATPIGNKRIFSGESYGHSSTETTPTKMVQAEAHIQSLQNTLVETLIGDIWMGEVDISWAQNRRMYMEYRPYIPNFCSADCRNFTSSFRCRLDGNNGEADDRITAKPDGVLTLVTNKKSDPNSKVIWSLQGAALAFEVHRFLCIC